MGDVTGRYPLDHHDRRAVLRTWHERYGAEQSFSELRGDLPGEQAPTDTWVFHWF